MRLVTSSWERFGLFCQHTVPVMLYILPVIFPAAFEVETMPNSKINSNATEIIFLICFSFLILFVHKRLQTEKLSPQTTTLSRCGFPAHCLQGRLAIHNHTHHLLYTENFDLYKYDNFHRPIINKNQNNVLDFAIILLDPRLSFIYRSYKNLNTKWRNENETKTCMHAARTGDLCDYNGEYFRDGKG